MQCSCGHMSAMTLSIQLSAVPSTSPFYQCWSEFAQVWWDQCLFSAVTKILGVHVITHFSDFLWLAHNYCMVGRCMHGFDYAILMHVRDFNLSVKSRSGTLPLHYSWWLKSLTECMQFLMLVFLSGRPLNPSTVMRLEVLALHICITGIVQGSPL